MRRRLQRGDWMAIVITAAFGIFVLFVAAFLPEGHGVFNLGFGPDWNCTNTSPEPACTRPISRSLR